MAKSKPLLPTQSIQCIYEMIVAKPTVVVHCARNQFRISKSLYETFGPIPVPDMNKNKFLIKQHQKILINLM